MMSPDLLDRLDLRGGIRGLRQGANDGTARETDLEFVVFEAFGILEQRIGGGSEQLAARRLATQQRFRRGIAPGLVSDAAERQPRQPDAAVLEFERGRDRDQCEGIR
jgi:hypothetical protein